MKTIAALLLSIFVAQLWINVADWAHAKVLAETAPMPPPPMPMRQRPVMYIPPTTPVLRAMQDMSLEEVVDYWKTNRQNCAVMQWRFH